MRANVFTAVSEDGRGFTLIEILVSMVIFSILILVSVTIFRNSVYRFDKETSEKKLYSEAARVFEYVEKYLSSAMCGELEDGVRINFSGEDEQIRFVSPSSKGAESDLAKLGIYFDRDASAVKIAMERISRDKPDFNFPEGFSGAQIIGEGIKSFHLSYFDGVDWQREWKTENMASPELPRMIRIELTCFSKKLGGESGERTFEKNLRIER